MVFVRKLSGLRLYIIWSFTHRLLGLCFSIKKRSLVDVIVVFVRKLSGLLYTEVTEECFSTAVSPGLNLPWLFGCKLLVLQCIYYRAIYT